MSLILYQEQMNTEILEYIKGYIAGCGGKLNKEQSQKLIAELADRVATNWPWNTFPTTQPYIYESTRCIGCNSKTGCNCNVPPFIVTYSTGTDE